MQNMTPDLKEKWIKALRGEILDRTGGEYQQARKVFRVDTLLINGKKEIGYCCLGVLADLCDVTWITQDMFRQDYQEFGFEDNEAHTHRPDGLLSNLPETLQEELQVMNDNRKATFAEIATFIDDSITFGKDCPLKTDKYPEPRYY